MPQRNRLSRRGALGAILAGAIAAGRGVRAAASRDIEVTEARARATPKDDTTSTAYMTVINRGVQNDRLVGIYTPVAESVKIEKPVWHGLTMRMEQQREVDIPANTTVQFRPGRYQLTLAGLSRQLRPNTTVPLELRFERAGRVDVTMKVVNKLLGN